MQHTTCYQQDACGGRVGVEIDAKAGVDANNVRKIGILGNAAARTDRHAADVTCA
jgi:hypothetical protein